MGTITYNFPELIYIFMDTREENDEPNLEEGPVAPPMCSVCHCDPPVNAVQINCGHIFCYLCIKSASETTGTCPLCRNEIGIEFNFQEHPILGDVARVPSSSDDGCYWFYEGYRGWWLYDPETNRDIEKAYQKRIKGTGAPKLEKFIAGHIYEIDLILMAQQRKDGEGKARKICRATLELENILGMAGLKGQDFNEMLDMMKSDDFKCVVGGAGGSR